MAEKQNQVKKQRATNRVFIWILLATIIAIVLSFQIYQNVSQHQELNRSLNDARQEQEKAQVLKLELQAQVELLKNDEYILKLARSRGFYSYSNEIIFNLPSENSLLKQEKVREQQESQSRQTTEE